MVIGQPIFPPSPRFVDGGDRLDPQQVDEYHQQYISALQNLFDEYKLPAGYARDRSLKII